MNQIKDQIIQPSNFNHFKIIKIYNKKKTIILRIIVDYKEKINVHIEKITNYKSFQIQSSANQELKKWQDLKEMLLLKSTK